MVRIPKDFERVEKYPKTYGFLMDYLPYLAQIQLRDDKARKIWKAFCTHGQMSEQEAKDALRVNGGPVLWFSDLQRSCGYYADGSSVIHLNKEVGRRFEDKSDDPDAMQYVSGLVLHETIHWAIHQLRKTPNPSIEPGNEFEIEAYSGMLSPFWGAANCAAGPARTDRAHIAASNAIAGSNGTLASDSSLLPDAIPGPAGFFREDAGEGHPRGIRNHNPGNIKNTGVAWQGLATEQEMTEFQREENVFCVFKEPKWGLRALARLLRNYQALHQLDSVMQMISRWAPAHDNNDTMSYARNVADHMGVDLFETINVNNPHQAIPMIEAIIQQENSDQPYSRYQIEEGFIISARVDPRTI